MDNEVQNYIQTSIEEGIQRALSNLSTRSNIIQGNSDSSNVEQKIAKEKLIKALMTDPILACPDFSKEFVVQVDDSEVGVGAILGKCKKEEKKLLHTRANPWGTANENFVQQKEKLLLSRLQCNNSDRTSFQRCKVTTTNNEHACG